MQNTTTKSHLIIFLLGMENKKRFRPWLAEPNPDPERESNKVPIKFKRFNIVKACDEGETAQTE